MYLRVTTHKARATFCISVARRTLADFQKDRGPLQAPMPIEQLVQWLGFQVIPLSTVDDEFSALVSMKDKLIGLNANHHIHRKRFSIGHELGHILLKHPPESRCATYEIRLYNAEADFCASELLIPQAILAEWLGKTKNPVELARIFNVSVEAMMRKVAQAQNGEN
ncbi:MAG TPA: ImmA/IrrE family metallo-endopeptidase [Bacteroidota bacterium]|nr:ImmA/IrrE family metallo-endopeptidase [Bacteroidota bacterium]